MNESRITRRVDIPASEKISLQIARTTRRTPSLAPLNGDRTVTSHSQEASETPRAEISFSAGSSRWAPPATKEAALDSHRPAGEKKRLPRKLPTGEVILVTMHQEQGKKAAGEGTYYEKTQTRETADVVPETADKGGDGNNGGNREPPVGGARDDHGDEGRNENPEGKPKNRPPERATPTLTTSQRRLVIISKLMERQRRLEEARKRGKRKSIEPIEEVAKALGPTYPRNTVYRIARELRKYDFIEDPGSEFTKPRRRGWQERLVQRQELEKRFGKSVENTEGQQQEHD